MSLPPTAVAHARPAHPMLLSAIVVLFVGALITDIAYSRTFDAQWKTFSDWLLAGGTAVAGLAGLVGLVDLSRRRVRANGLIWPYALANLLAFLLGLANDFVHSRDAYRGVMPTGLTLSVLTVIVLAITVPMAVMLIYNRRTGVIR